MALSEINEQFLVSIYDDLVILIERKTLLELMVLQKVCLINNMILIVYIYVI